MTVLCRKYFIWAKFEFDINYPENLNSQAIHWFQQENEKVFDANNLDFEEGYRLN